jgi:hypothetical protein
VRFELIDKRRSAAALDLKVGAIVEREDPMAVRSALKHSCILGSISDGALEFRQ